MMRMPRSVLLLAAALLGLAAAAAPASAAANRYGIVGIENPTNIPITYEFRWGEDGDWQSYTLAPGERRWHAWTYEYLNENASPRPHVRFDCDLSEELEFKEYGLEAYAAPYKGFDFAKKYVFRKRGGFLDLYAR
jgi:hypothetical protein